MSISVKIERKFKDIGFAEIQAAKKKFYEETAKQLPYVIASVIQKGISPVEGIGRFIPYSASYVAQIEGNKKTIYGVAQGKTGKTKSTIKVKKFTFITRKAGLGVGKLKSPVNMTVTGVMVGSIQGNVVANGVEIKFDSPIAKYHNGQGGVNRHILPKDSETFSSLIMKKLRDILREAFNN